MFIEAFVNFAFGFGTQAGGELVHGPNSADVLRAALRWTHLVAGVAWVGLLYFFNLVNVPLMAALDAETKKKLIPELMTRALWYFRWGAVATVLAGAVYYAVFILASEAATAGISPMGPFMHWFGTSIIFYAFIYALYMVPALNKDGRLLALAIAVIVVAMLFVLVKIMGGMGTAATGHFMGNKSLSIAAGGGLGMIMLLNVWGVIWRCQKQIIAGVVSGNPAPPELARKAFLASRTNFWLSFPMLFFMGTSHGDWVMFGQ